jgi:hypothetical protein
MENLFPVLWVDECRERHAVHHLDVKLLIRLTTRWPPEDSLALLALKCRPLAVIENQDVRASLKHVGIRKKDDAVREQPP